MIETIEEDNYHKIVDVLKKDLSRQDNTLLIIKSYSPRDFFNTFKLGSPKLEYINNKVNFCEGGSLEVISTRLVNTETLWGKSYQKIYRAKKVGLTTRQVEVLDSRIHPKAPSKELPHFDELWDDITTTIFSEKYEPSERGAGWAVTDLGREAIIELVEEYLNAHGVQEYNTITLEDYLNEAEGEYFHEDSVAAQNRLEAYLEAWIEKMKFPEEPTPKHNAKVDALKYAYGYWKDNPFGSIPEDCVVRVFSDSENACKSHLEGNWNLTTLDKHAHPCNNTNSNLNLTTNEETTMYTPLDMKEIHYWTINNKKVEEYSDTQLLSIIKDLQTAEKNLSDLNVKSTRKVEMLKELHDQQDKVVEVLDSRAKTTEK